MERENSRLHGRNPTLVKELETDAAKREMRKKLYRNRQEIQGQEGSTGR